MRSEFTSACVDPAFESAFLRIYLTSRPRSRGSAESGAARIPSWCYGLAGAGTLGGPVVVRPITSNAGKRKSLVLSKRCGQHFGVYRSSTLEIALEEMHGIDML